MISIVDYGLGNIGSIVKIINHVGYDAKRVSTPESIKKSTLLILPGVGSFDNAMESLNSLNLIGALNEMALVKKIPVLGICLGMQIMCKSSEEGTSAGLGWVEADVFRFKLKNKKVPHMGWNTVLPSRTTRLYDKKNESKFYFVHSFYVECKNKEDIASTTKYEIQFTSSFEVNNIYGVQFHPEKSHIFGINFFKNFLQNNA